MKEYITVSEASYAEYTEKHSRFLAAVYPCETEEQAIGMIRKVRAEHWGAKHHCYAFSVECGAIRRFSDDGEPHGTAGKPIFDVMEGSRLNNVLIVVTRYFGGVLLGTGGLARAYSKAAKDAVEKAVKAIMTPCTVLVTVCSYSDREYLQSRIEEAGGVLEKTDFASEVTLTYHLETAVVPDFLARLREGFSNKITAEIIAERLCPVRRE